VSRRIGPIDLERDQATTAGNIQLRPLAGAEHHHLAVEDEIDRQHHRPAIIDESHPPQLLPGQQPEALAFG